MNEFDKTNEQDVTKGSNRRSFLKKSATGAVVFSLPAKSVWGACSVSGAMSGNLSTNIDRHTCTIPALDFGAKPFKWQDFNSHANELFSHLNANKLTNNSNNKNAETIYLAFKNKYVQAVDAQKSMNLDLPIELTATSPTCGAALTSTDPMFVVLGAIFLNASFGLYPGYSGSVEAIQLVNDVFLYAYTNEAQGNIVTLSDGACGFTANHASSALDLS